MLAALSSLLLMRVLRRPLTIGETAMARSVFQGAIDYARVRVVRRDIARIETVVGERRRKPVAAAAKA